MFMFIRIYPIANNQGFPRLLGVFVKKYISLAGARLQPLGQVSINGYSVFPFLTSRVFHQNLNSKFPRIRQFIYRIYVRLAR